MNSIKVFTKIIPFTLAIALSYTAKSNTDIFGKPAEGINEEFTDCIECVTQQFEDFCVEWGTGAACTLHCQWERHFSI